MSKLRKGLYVTGNLLLPLSELRRVLRSVYSALTRTGVVTADALTLGLREARTSIEHEHERAGVTAPVDTRAMARQWWAGAATILLGLACIGGLWMSEGVASKLALIILGTALVGTGSLMAGACAYAVHRAAGRVHDVQAWVRQPRLWVPHSGKESRT